jgi:mannose-1-phosphate guanylyltransferase
MQALILAGGAGTRLRPLTYTVPKPVLPLAGRPLVAYMIDWLERHGVTDVVIACGFLAEGMRPALAGHGGPRLRFVEEPEPRGTGGAVRFAEQLLDDRFFVLNGDVLMDLDLSGLTEQHERTGARATIALHPVSNPSAYGLVRRLEDGEVTEFLEKPKRSQIDTDEINAGAYLLERSILEQIPPDREVSIEREVFPRLIGEGLFGRRLEGYWLDIGTPDRFLQATGDILEQRLRTVTGERLDERGLLVGTAAEISDSASIEPPAVIGGGSRIEAEARIVGPAAIGPDSLIGSGARLIGSVLFDGCRVGPGATVGKAILAAGVEVADGAAVPDGQVMGEGARV